MDNDITITLTNSAALDYIRAERQATSTTDALLAEITDLKSQLSYLTEEVSILRVENYTLKSKDTTCSTSTKQQQT